MKLHITPVAALVALVSLGSAFAGGEGWVTDFEAAKKQAASEKKDLLLDFTGSDWCGWCIKLNDEVFKKDAFKAGVKDKFVLVELDFPQDESKVPEATKKQNEDLQTKFGIEGFPSIVLCDASGKPYATTGYQAGGPEKYVASLDELRKKKTARDEAFAAAAKATGVDKAKQLVAALKAMELSDTAVSNFYSDLVPQIKEADPKDETGFVKDLEAKAKFAKFQEDLNKFGEEQDFEGALKFVDKSLKEDGYTGETKQQILATKGMIHAQMGKFDEALKAVDEAIAVDPKSEIGKQLPQLKERLAQAKAGGGKEEEEEAEKEEPEDKKGEEKKADKE